MIIDPAFFIFIAISAISFGIHSALIVSFARRFDAFIVAVYRNLSLVITMMPILFFVSWEDIVLIREHIPTLLLSSGIGSLAFTISMTGSRYLPIGVANSLRQTTTVPVAILIGILFLQEYLTFVQVLLLVGIGSCAIALTLLRSDHAHLDPKMAWRGVLLSVCAGFGGALSWYFFSILARDLHPFVASYFVEASIGFFTLFYFVILRGSGTHTSNIWLPLREIRNIVLVAMLTISATTSYAIGINHGSYPLASGLMMGTILVSTLMAWVFFKERLNKTQVALIIIAVILMFLIKMFS